MMINNEVYGTQEINEPVLLDLINSRLVQRLKGIYQYGMPPEYYHKTSYSRYEHSIGVFMLLREMNAELNEQAAGLLHDVSHTAFSHVIDWIVGSFEKEDFQDKNHQKILKDSEIPGILHKYNINWEEISDLENFSLLERESPSLCADRIDYTLQELKREGIDVSKYVESLVNYKGQIVFNSEETAESFARNYARLQREHWSGNEAKARYHILADISNKAMEKKIISFCDFSKTDQEVIDILKNSKDKEILEGLNLLKEGFKIEISATNSGILLKKKARFIDPEIIILDTVVKLSEICEGYKILLENEMKHQKEKMRILIKNEH